jgi:large subunit ribosomal protein L5
MAKTEKTESKKSSGPVKTPRVQTQYESEVKKKLVASGRYKNVMQVPKLEKIVISCSLKDALLNPKTLEGLAADIGKIAGQKPAMTKAKKAISNFKLRAGINLGCVVTLRRAKMYEFLDRFISIACPRIRDFRGFPEKSFDGRGNYSFGIKEHTIFPEVSYDQVDKVRGFNVTIGTSAKTDADALELLKEFGFPFRRQGN